MSAGIINDGTVENNETLTVELQTMDSRVTITSPTTVITIHDDNDGMRIALTTILYHATFDGARWSYTFALALTFANCSNIIGNLSFAIVFPYSDVHYTTCIWS